MIRIDGLNLHVAGRLLIEEFSFHLSRNERLGITGPSGVGKTTLLRAIAEGKLPEGSQAKRFSVNHVPGKLSYIPQSGGMLEWYTLRQHLALVPAETRQESLKRFERFCVLFNADGIQKKTHEQLSGGERQRGLLALHLSFNSDLYLIDEPMTGVDLSTKLRLLPIIARSFDEIGASCLLVSHDLDILSELCQRVLFLQDCQKKIELTRGNASTAAWRQTIHDKLLSG